MFFKKIDNKYYIDILKYQKIKDDKPLNKVVLNQVIQEFKNQVKSLNKGFNNCIFNNKTTVNKALTNTFLSIISGLKTVKDLKNLFNFNKNNKISIGINYKPYLLCLNMHKGLEACNLCKKCYSNRQELAKKNNKYYSLINSLSNFILFYYCIYSRNNNILFEAIKKAINYNTYSFKAFKVNRFNIKSDIDNQDILNLFNNIHVFLKRLFNDSLFYSYTYTKNKELDFKNIDKTFIISRSSGLKDMKYIKDNFKKLNTYNTFITVDKNQVKKEDLKFIINNCNICTVSRGLASNCLNCLNPCFKDDKPRNINICWLH